MRAAHAAAVAALQDGDRARLVNALRGMAVPAEDDVAEFAGVLLSLDEPASRERLLRIAAMNTRDSEQWRLLQLVPEIGVLRPPPTAVTAPTPTDRAEHVSGESSRLLGFLDRPSRERTVQAAETVQALAGMNRAMRMTALDEMSPDDLEPVVERALMSGHREVADAV
jgi:hypothetical protein